jgi:hypothetical protein
VGYKSVMFPKASSATHDRMVVALARDESLLVGILRQAWPHTFNGLGDPTVQRVLVEHPVTGRGNSVLGFVDLAVMVTGIDLLRELGRALYFYVEVKSGEFSIGELLRQVKFYQVHIPLKERGYWTVVSPLGCIR